MAYFIEHGRASTGEGETETGYEHYESALMSKVLSDVAGGIAYERVSGAARLLCLASLEQVMQVHVHVHVDVHVAMEQHVEGNSMQETRAFSEPEFQWKFLKGHNGSCERAGGRVRRGLGSVAWASRSSPRGSCSVPDVVSTGRYSTQYPVGLTARLCVVLVTGPGHKVSPMSPPLLCPLLYHDVCTCWPGIIIRGTMVHPCASPSRSHSHYSHGHHHRHRHLHPRRHRHRHRARRRRSSSI